MPSLQRLHGSSRRRSPTVPTNMRNITRASQLALGTLPTQHPYNLERLCPSRGRPPSSGSNPDSPGQQRHFGIGSNAIRNFPRRPTPEFTLIPMTYEDLLSSLITNQMAVISPEKIYQPPFPKWYNPDATCAYHGKTLGHSTEKCLALKYKVQHLIDAGWLTFQEDRPNVKTNPLSNHGGGAINAIELGRLCRS